MIDKAVRIHGFSIDNIHFYLDTHYEIFEIAGRGFVHPAQLVGNYTRNDLNRLFGHEVDGAKIRAVESFAVENQSNKSIGLVLDKRLWE